MGSGKGATAASAMAMSVDDAGDIAGDGWGDEDDEEGEVDVAVEGKMITKNMCNVNYEIITLLSKIIENIDWRLKVQLKKCIMFA